MDEARIESLGITPLNAELARIAKITDVRDLPAAFARASRIGVRLPFAVNVGADQRNSRSIRRADLAVGARHAGPRLLPAHRREVRRDAQVVHDLHRPPVRARQSARPRRRRRAHRRARDQARARSSGIARAIAIATRPTTRWASPSLQTSTPHFDWKAYLAALPAGAKDKVSEVIVRQPDYLKAVDAMLAETPIATRKEYLKFGLISEYADGLSAPFADSQFEFNGRVIAGRQQQQPRWKRGVSEVEQALGEPVGRLYIEKHFKPEAKARMDALIRNLLAAFKVGDRRARVDVAGDQVAGEGQAREVQVKIAYPDQWRDYSALEIKPRRSHRQPDPLPRVPVRGHAWTRLGKPVERWRWGLTPQTVNASLQRDQQRDHLSGRHPAAAVLRPGRRRRDQLRRDRRGDRPRDQPRLRRPGPQVRRRRQPARLVDGRRRASVRGARRQAGRAVRVATRRCPA